MMVFESQLGIRTSLEERTEPQGLVIQFRQFGKTITVGIITATFSVLPEYVKSRLMIVCHQRCIQCSIVFEYRSTANTGKGMRELSGVVCRFFGDDVDGSGNG